MTIACGLMKFIKNNKLIDSAAEVARLAKILSQEKVITLDTEFIREKTFYPIVALIQVGTKTESWLVDPLALRKEELQPLLDVFTDKNILKIIHAAQADQECLFTSYGIVASPSFDTAAGGSLCGFGESPGLAKLTKEILGVSLDKGHARTDWTVRPLPEQLCKYAHQDVEFLIPLTDHLFSRLEKNDRKKWALELSAKYEDPKIFEPLPEDHARKIVKTRSMDKKGFAALIELIRWREARVKSLDVPRKWIADDDLLTSLANVRPKDMAHLSAFRGLNKGELKHSGEAILEAIKVAAARTDVVAPDRTDSTEPEEARAIEVLGVFLKILAEQNEIAPKLLMTNDALLQLLRSKITDTAELVSQGILTQGACDLVGQPLIDLLTGKRSISLQGCNVVLK